MQTDRPTRSQIQIEGSFIAGSTPKDSPSQEAFIDERRESTHIMLIHKFSHPAPNMREPTGQLGVPVATLVKQRATPITYRLIYASQSNTI
jgi:hypothetical protein